MFCFTEKIKRLEAELGQIEQKIKNADSNFRTPGLEQLQASKMMVLKQAPVVYSQIKMVEGIIAPLLSVLEELQSEVENQKSYHSNMVQFITNVDKHTASQLAWHKYMLEEQRYIEDTHA